MGFSTDIGHNKFAVDPRGKPKNCLMRRTGKRGVIKDCKAGFCDAVDELARFTHTCSNCARCCQSHKKTGRKKRVASNITPPLPSLRQDISRTSSGSKRMPTIEPPRNTNISSNTRCDTYKLTLTLSPTVHCH